MEQFDRKTYMRDYQREWVRRRRDAWMTENGPCRSCGAHENLEIDHIDESTKLFQPSTLWSKRSEVRESELAKCQVLCETCHTAKTRAWQQARAKPCGTWQSYSRGCRCGPCTDAEAAYARERRKRKRSQGA